MDQALALDAFLFLRDPFAVVNPQNLFNSGLDRNTRVMLFVTNFQLSPGEPASAITVNVVDSSNQTFDDPADDVRQLAGTPFFQVTFRLPSNLAIGRCLVTLRAHSQISNTGSIRIRGQD